MKIKTFITAFLCILIATCAFGQIELKFTGVLNAINTKLDSVKIVNVDRNCDTTIKWPDTVLSLNSLGIYNFNSPPDEFQVYQNVPNPVFENTKILLYLPRNGIVDIDVSILNGMQVTSFRKELQRGPHSFLFAPQNTGNYIFTAKFQSVRKSIKIVSCMTQAASGYTLTYNGLENENSVQKKVLIVSKFVFTNGDLLDLKGYHNGLIASTQDAPVTNQSYSFNFSPTGIPCPGVPTVKYLGQTYHTVQIGTQCWFRENLNVGTRIDGAQDQTDNGIVEKYCPDDLDANCKIYGGLYQWNEVMQYVTTPGTKGICPVGWHIPTDAEWTILVGYLGGESIAGGKLKYSGTFESGTGLWSAPNSGASNNSGFTALPAGSRSYNGILLSLGQYVDYWSSTFKPNTESSWDYNLNYNYGNVARMSYSHTYGFSCRCIID